MKKRTATNVLIAAIVPIVGLTIGLGLSARASMSDIPSSEFGWLMTTSPNTGLCFEWFGSETAPVGMWEIDCAQPWPPPFPETEHGLERSPVPEWSWGGP